MHLIRSAMCALLVVISGFPPLFGGSTSGSGFLSYCGAICCASNIALGL